MAGELPINNTPPMIHLYSPDRLRSLRLRALLSQRDVERLSGISDATIAYLETGRHRPQSGTLRKLLLLYDLNIRRLEQSERLWGMSDEQSGAPRGQSGRAKSPRANLTRHADGDSTSGAPTLPL